MPSPYLGTPYPIQLILINKYENSGIKATMGKVM